MITKVGEFTLEKRNGMWMMMNEDRVYIAYFNDECLAALHLLTSDVLACSNEKCPCRRAGYEKGVEAPREPQRSRA